MLISIRQGLEHSPACQPKLPVDPAAGSPSPGTSTSLCFGSVAADLYGAKWKEGW